MAEDELQTMDIDMSKDDSEILDIDTRELEHYICATIFSCTSKISKWSPRYPEFVCSCAVKLQGSFLADRLPTSIDFLGVQIGLIFGEPEEVLDASIVINALKKRSGFILTNGSDTLLSIPEEDAITIFSRSVAIDGTEGYVLNNFKDLHNVEKFLTSKN